MLWDRFLDRYKDENPMADAWHEVCIGQLLRPVLWTNFLTDTDAEAATNRKAVMLSCEECRWNEVWGTGYLRKEKYQFCITGLHTRHHSATTT